MGRWPARSRSSSSARTAAGSSTRTRRRRSRTRTPFTQLRRALRDPHHPVRARLHVRPHGEGQAPGPRGVRHHGRSSGSRSPLAAIFVRGRRQPAARPRPAPTRRSPRLHPAGTWRARRSGSGRSGSAIWAAATTGHVERLGQLDARQLHAARRWCRARAHEARRGEPGRRRRRASTGCSSSRSCRCSSPASWSGARRSTSGKKIQASEVKLVALYILAMPFVAARVPRRRRCSSTRCTNTTIFNPGQHGFTEILYAYTSAANNNGSAFAGHHRGHAVDEHDARASRCCSAGSSCIIPTLAIAGALARKQQGAGERRHVPDPHAALRGARDRRDRHRRCAHVPPGPRARSDRRAARI